MKKMLSIFLSFLMVMTFVPASVLAVGEQDLFSISSENATNVYAPIYSSNLGKAGDDGLYSFESFPYNVAAIIQDFDTWVSDDVSGTVGCKVTTYAHNSEGEMASFDLEANGDDQSLKINRKANQNHAIINELLVSKYIADANGIAFHVDATAVANDINIRLYICFLGGPIACNWYGMPYYFVEDGKQTNEYTEKVISGYDQWFSWISLAAGKSGTYFFPFTSFQPPEEVTQISDNYKFDIAACVGKTIDAIQFQVSGVSEDAFIIDDLAWTTADGSWNAPPIPDLGYKTAKIFQDFNKWNNTTDVSGRIENGSKVITWKHNNQGEVPTFDLVSRGEGKALKMKRNSDNNNALIDEIYTRKYIADANGISFYYDGTKVESKTNIRITFECDGKIAFPWFGNSYYFVEDGKQMNEYTEMVISGYDQQSSWINLTAGKAGTYFIPFAVFKIPDIIEMDESNSIYDFDPIESIDKDITNFIFLVAEISEDPFIIDDLAWTTVDGYWRFWDESIQNAWTLYEDQWYYIHNGDLLINSWKQDSVGWVYLGSDGLMVKNDWVLSGNKWYFMDANGYMVSNKWKADSIGWCYLGSDGAMKTNAWVKDSNGWCYVGANGYCVTNQWMQDSTKKWCYLNANGNMVVNNWVQSSGKWYFMDANGYMVSNAWKKDSNGWCYLGSDGAMKTNAWVKDSNGWCYVGANGYCVTNKWVADSKGWCYLNSNGNMVVNNWVYSGGNWYFMDANGYMISNTSKYWNGKTYDFNANGVCTNP